LYNLTSSIPRNRATGVSPYIKSIKLIFSRSFNVARGLVDVENTIEMWTASNPRTWAATRIPVRIKTVCDGPYSRRVILVIPLVPLKGGVTYKIRVKSTLYFRDGTTATRCKLIVFTTGCRS
jgi:hypothetical protein